MGPDIDCAQLQGFLKFRYTCEPSSFGLKILTDCLYPSADPVFVHIAATSSGYRVTDGGGIVESVVHHGRNDKALMEGLATASRRHSVRIENGSLYAEVPSADWLPSAVMAVANAAALAANLAVEQTTKAVERGVGKRIYTALETVFQPNEIAREYEFIGRSGKTWKIDFAIPKLDRPILIRSVTPHHNSISSNYTTFGDIGVDETRRICVFQKSLEHDDASLIRQVADLLPLSALELSAQQALHIVH